MKTIIVGFAIVSAVFTACSNNSSSPKENRTDIDTAKTSTGVINTATNQTASMDEIVNAYLKLKNALTNDNGNDAADAGKQLSEAIAKINEAAFNSEQKKVYNNVKEDIKEHAEHISANGVKISHQREHFDMLSKDMYDLVKAFKPSQTLYQDYCPMYNDGKGATWLSEVKKIKNPYYGKEMPDCGTVKEEIKQ